MSESVFAAFFLAALGASAAAAADQAAPTDVDVARETAEQAPIKPADSGANAPPIPAGMIAFRDPVTGRLRAPTADEYRRFFQNMLQRPNMPLKAGRKPDGTVWALLGPYGMTFSVATRTSDGKIAISHVNSEKEWNEFRNAAPQKRDLR